MVTLAMSWAAPGGTAASLGPKGAVGGARAAKQGDSVAPMSDSAVPPPLQQEERARAIYAQAIDHTRRGELDDALKCYSRALDLVPKGRDSHVWLANRATLRLRAGDVAGAQRDCEAALVLRPKYAKASTRLGLVLLHKGDIAGALACYHKALRIDPVNDVAIALIAEAIIAQEQRWRQEDACRAEEGRRAQLAEAACKRQEAEEAYEHFVEACAARKSDGGAVLVRTRPKNGSGDLAGGGPRSKSLPRSRLTALEAAERAQQEAEEWAKLQAEGHESEPGVGLRCMAGKSSRMGPAQRCSRLGSSESQTPCRSPASGPEGWGWDRERERTRHRAAEAAKIAAAVPMVLHVTNALNERTPSQLAEAEPLPAPARFHHRVVRGVRSLDDQAAASAAAAAATLSASAASAAAAEDAAARAPPFSPPPVLEPLAVPQTTTTGVAAATAGAAASQLPSASRNRPPRPDQRSSNSREDPTLSPLATAATTAPAAAAAAATAAAAAAAAGGARSPHLWKSEAAASPTTQPSKGGSDAGATVTAGVSPASFASQSPGGPNSRTVSPMGPPESFESFNEPADAADAPAAAEATVSKSSEGARSAGRSRAPMDTVAAVAALPHPRRRLLSEPPLSRGRRRQRRRDDESCDEEEEAEDTQYEVAAWQGQVSAASEEAEADLQQAAAPNMWTWKPPAAAATADAGSWGAWTNDGGGEAGSRPSSCSSNSSVSSALSDALNGASAPQDAGEPSNGHGGASHTEGAGRDAAAEALFNSSSNSSSHGSNSSGSSVHSSMSDNSEAVRTQVRAWLEAVLGRSSKQPLGAWLADGRVLVDVANELAPGAVKDWRAGWTREDRQHNVAAFLCACELMGMPDSALFRPNDVIDGDDLRRVVDCLHFLGEHIALLAPRYNGPMLREQ